MVLPRAPLNLKVSRIYGVQRLSLALRRAAWFIHTLSRAGIGRGAVVFRDYSMIAVILHFSFVIRYGNLGVNTLILVHG
jgi:hypothetical protein